MLKKSFFAKITGIRRGDDEEVDEIVEVNAAISENKEFESGVITQADREQSSDDDSADWVEQNYEGQLSVDVYQTKDEIVIKSAIAGVESDDLDISISNDMITIRGTRKQDEEVSKEDYFYQECYWGSFSRSVILPQEVQADAATADFKKGILIIRLPKAAQVQKIKVKVNE